MKIKYHAPILYQLHCYLFFLYLIICLLGAFFSSFLALFRPPISGSETLPPSTPILGGRCKSLWSVLISESKMSSTGTGTYCYEPDYLVCTDSVSLFACIGNLTHSTNTSVCCCEIRVG
jgi:hypothetical protein